MLAEGDNENLAGRRRCQQIFDLGAAPLLVALVSWEDRDPEFRDTYREARCSAVDLLCEMCSGPPDPDDNLAVALDGPNLDAVLREGAATAFADLLADEGSPRGGGSAGGGDDADARSGSDEDGPGTPGTPGTPGGDDELLVTAMNGLARLAYTPVGRGAVYEAVSRPRPKAAFLNVLSWPTSGELLRNACFLLENLVGDDASQTRAFKSAANVDDLKVR